MARLTAAPAETAQEAQADLEAAALEGSEVGLMRVGPAARVFLEARPALATMAPSAVVALRRRRRRPRRAAITACLRPTRLIT